MKVKRNIKIFRFIFTLMLGLIYFNKFLYASANVYGWDTRGADNFDFYTISAIKYTNNKGAIVTNLKSDSWQKFVFQADEIDPGETYKFTAWVRNDAVSEFRLYLGFDDHDRSGDSGWGADDDYTDVPSGSSTFQFYSVTLKPSSNSYTWYQVGFRINPGVAYSNEYCYFDNAKFFATNNPNVNLLINGDFETATGPSGGEVFFNYPASNAKLILDRKIFSPHDNEKVKINFNLPYKNSDLLIRAYDSKGNIVRDIYNTDELGSTFSSCSGTVYWDGKDDFGKIVHIGAYFIYLEATNRYTGEVTRLKELIIVGRALE